MPAKKPSSRATVKNEMSASPKKSPAQIARAKKLFSALKKLHPTAHCELDYRSPHELLIATILSAQTTDVAVNKATPALFRAFSTPAAFAKATPEQIEPYVKTLGFFRMKAKSVHEAMKAVVERFGGRVPQTMDELLTLRGVARKTANVVLSNAFGINEGVVVDTHVTRLVQRLGLSTQTDPKKIELDLMAQFPKKDWGLLSHLLIFHGRRYCKARHDLCKENAVCKEFCTNVNTNPSPRKRKVTQS